MEKKQSSKLEVKQLPPVEEEIKSTGAGGSSVEVRGLLWETFGSSHRTWLVVEDSVLWRLKLSTSYEPFQFPRVSIKLLSTSSTEVKNIPRKQ